MPKRIVITLVIIAGIGVGAGALVMGVLLMRFGNAMDKPGTIAAIGSAILASGVAGMVAHLNGAFRGLDDPIY
jgi:hypothetical protein